MIALRIHALEVRVAQTFALSRLLFFGNAFVDRMMDCPNA
jgi:hypothetical protein